MIEYTCNTCGCSLVGDTDLDVRGDLINTIEPCPDCINNAEETANENKESDIHNLEDQLEELSREIDSLQATIEDLEHTNG